MYGLIIGAFSHSDEIFNHSLPVVQVVGLNPLWYVSSFFHHPHRDEPSQTYPDPA